MMIRMLGLALLALLLACPSRDQPPVTVETTMPATANPPGPAAELAGEQVTISTVGDFRVGHDRFRLHNVGSDELVAAFDNLWLDVNGKRQSLQLGSIFEMERGQNLDPTYLRLAPGETLSLLIGFPSFVHNPKASEQTAAVVRLRAGARMLEASSPLRFERRIPR